MYYIMHGILQARLLEWLPFLSPGGLPNPGIEPRSPTLQVDSLPSEPQGKPKNTGVGSLSLLHWIFPTQELNRGLLHCRRILTNWAINKCLINMCWMNKEWSNGLSRCSWGFNLMGAEMWSLTFAEGTPLVTLLSALLVKWQGKPDYRGAGGENEERTDDEKTQEWRPQYGRVLENYEWVLKFSGNWRDHGVPLIKWALVVRWKLSCTEGETDDSEAKISNCQCKHLENFDKLGVGVIKEVRCISSWMSQCMWAQMQVCWQNWWRG